MTRRLEDQPWMTAPATRRVLDALEAAGGPDCARFVGGCVRNALMGAPVADVDIATRLTPDEVMRALKASGLRAIPTGLEHGTVTAIADGAPFEITTLRRDVQTDGRRAVVAFSTLWAEDAQRRDFRLNALYADRAGVVFDEVDGGIDDALAGRIVFVGDPENRLREDYLRILRFFRFYAWYGRGPADEVGLQACRDLRDGLKSLSAERISKELLKLLAAPDPRPSIGLMAQAGVLDMILPSGLRPDRFEALVGIDPDPLLRLSALLPDDPITVGAAADRLRLSNTERDRLVDALASPPVVTLDLPAQAARAAIYQLGPAVFADRVRRAWAEAPDRSGEAERLLQLCRSWALPRFPLRGPDVTELGVAIGPEVGRLLREVETWWISEDFPPAPSARARLLALVGEER